MEQIKGLNSSSWHKSSEVLIWNSSLVWIWMSTFDLKLPRISQVSAQQCGWFRFSLFGGLIPSASLNCLFRSAWKNLTIRCQHFLFYFSGPVESGFKQTVIMRVICIGSHFKDNLTLNRAHVVPHYGLLVLFLFCLWKKKNLITHKPEQRWWKML